MHNPSIGNIFAKACLSLPDSLSETLIQASLYDLDGKHLMNEIRASSNVHYLSSKLELEAALFTDIDWSSQ